MKDLIHKNILEFVNNDKMKTFVPKDIIQLLTLSLSLLFLW